MLVVESFDSGPEFRFDGFCVLQVLLFALSKPFGGCNGFLLHIMLQAGAVTFQRAVPDNADDCGSWVVVVVGKGRCTG
jgi:hypothetical protein